MLVRTTLIRPFLEIHIDRNLPNLLWLEPNPTFKVQGTAGGSSKHSVSREQWEERMAGVGVDKAAMNRAIMGYLVTQGLVDVARCFQEETGISRKSMHPEMLTVGEVLVPCSVAYACGLVM